MILLCGDNNFELTKKVAQYKAEFKGEAEQCDGKELSSEKLADIFAGQSLFATKRLVIIDTPSDSTDLWGNLEAWNARLSDDVTLLLIEPKPDKRTSAYKWLKKHADVQEFISWTSRDERVAEEWLRSKAHQQGTDLTHAQARLLIHRVGLDQWQLYHALEKVALLDTVNEETITEITDQHPQESVFALFETALNGDAGQVHEIIKDLERSEDPYRTFGLLGSQMIQLTALALGSRSVNTIASEIGASPYGMNKLASYANRLSREQISKMVHAFAHVDMLMKSSGSAEPWAMIERLLIEVTDIV